MASTSDSIYDIEASTGITTSVVDPAVVLGAMSPHAYSGAPSPIATSAPHTEEPIIGARCPSDVAPFVEPLDVNRHANIQRRVTSNVITQPPTPTTITTTASALPSISTTTNKNEKQATTTTTTTKSFIRSLKGLTLHRPKEDKRVTTTTMTTTTETTTTKPWDIPFGSRPPNDVYYSGSHSGRSTSSSSAASIALQMLDPSNREMARIPTNESTRQPYISTQVISVDKGDDTASKASVTWTSTASTSAISTTSSMSSAYYPSHYAPSSLPSSSNVTIVAFPPPPLPPPTIPPPTNPVRRSRPLPTPPVAHPPLTHGLPSPPNTPV
ncbi:hypothetical protein FRC17_006471 [Serendipita sp. 399]|nr:hypothetical protein FRC17_006471 [Serendipita sp. 399]